MTGAGDRRTARASLRHDASTGAGSALGRARPPPLAIAFALLRHRAAC